MASGASASPAPAPTWAAPAPGSARIGVSGNRVLWVRYNGGNERDWQLMTATTTQRTPRQLRFVPQDVELPSPFAIGDSTVRPRDPVRRRQRGRPARNERGRRLQARRPGADRGGHGRARPRWGGRRSAARDGRDRAAARRRHDRMDGLVSGQRRSGHRARALGTDRPARRVGRDSQAVRRLRHRQRFPPLP